MEHGPLAEQPNRHGLRYLHCYIDVPVVASDALERSLDGIFWPLQHLKVDVLAANERSGDAVPNVATPGVEQYTIQRCLVVTERL